ncbi:MAG: ribulose-bisphosphate carboxylase large subunit [Thermoplasmatota archaeon]
MRGMGYKDFIQLDAKPGPRELACTFRVTPRPGTEFAFVAGGLAAESSIGTWDPDLATMQDHPEARQWGARVFALDEAQGIVKIAYPIELFEKGSLPQLLSSVVGNVYGLKEVQKLRFLDCEMPEEWVRSFAGPQLGLDGLRRLTGVRDRPWVGTIVKPKLGLDAEAWSEAAYRAWSGGLDIVKDDENLTSMAFNNFYVRTRKVVEKKRRAEDETGEKKLYFANISGPYEEMKRRADHMIALGNEYVMIDILTVGFSALQAMRQHLEGSGVAIHAHRAMHGSFSRLEDHGIDMLPVSKWARLAGVDNIHAGTMGAGKMFAEGGRSHAQQIYEFLRSDWYGIKKTLPVASGGVHPGVIHLLVERAGLDFAAMCGGGVHGHPEGSKKGAMAVRAAVEAAVKGIRVEEAAKRSPELAVAIKKWGTEPIGGDE